MHIKRNWTEVLLLQKKAGNFMEKTKVSKLKIIESYYEEIASRGIQEYLDYLQFMTKGNLYRYNLNNQILIYKQNPQAELVATYDAWRQQGYGLRKHSAIHADRNDKMTGLDYLFEADDVIGLKPEDKEQYIWRTEDSDYDSINQFFSSKKETFTKSVMWASHQAFSKTDILNREKDAQSLAENAANYMILGRCGIFYPFEETIKEKFDRQTAGERRQMIERVQPYVSQFSGLILGNIGRIVKNNEKNKKEAEQILQAGGKNGAEKAEGYQEKSFDRRGNAGVYAGRDRRGNRTDFGTGGGRGRDTSTGAIELSEQGNKEPKQIKEKTVTVKNKLEDFGEKIGGAKKDLWKRRGLDLADIVDMDVVDRETYINKNHVWPKPDYQGLKDSGIPTEVVYFYKKMRDSLPIEPPVKTKEKQNTYISFVSDLKEAVMSCQKPEDTKEFLSKFFIQKGYLVNKGYYVAYADSDYMGIITDKVVKASQTSQAQLQREIVKKQFLYSQDEKILANYQIIQFDDRHTWKEENREIQGIPEKNIFLKREELYGFRYIYPKNEFANQELWKKDTWYVLKKGGEVVGINFPDKEIARKFALEDGRPKYQEKESVKKAVRKKKLVPKALKAIERTGLPDVCGGKDVTAEDFMGRFGIKGGEFGNWLSETEKQTNLNMAYEAFSDLALALDVDEKDISLDGRLSIAFGARGSGNALAHYEPAVQVINLTRMKGAGSLSHEWGHALDDITKRICEGVPIEMTKMIESLKFQTESSWLKSETRFYQEAKHLDRIYSKCDKGYWSSNEELFARAFACYVKDKLAEKGGRSDHLNGHADSVEVFDSDGIDTVSGFPKGKEREQINKKFDFLIEQYKERGILHAPEQAPIIAHVR